MMYSFPTPPRVLKPNFSEEELVEEYIRKCTHHFDGQQNFADAINQKLDQFGVISTPWNNDRISSVKGIFNKSPDRSERAVENSQNEFGRFTRILWVIEIIHREILIEEQKRSIGLSGTYVAISPSFNVFNNICVGLMIVKSHEISLFTINRDNAVAETLRGYLYLSDLFSQGLAAHISSADREQSILFRGPEAGRRRAITIGRTDGGASPYAMPYVMYQASATETDEESEIVKKVKTHCNIYSPDAFREKCNDKDFAAFFPDGYGCDQIINGLNEAGTDGIVGLKID